MRFLVDDLRDERSGDPEPDRDFLFEDLRAALLLGGDREADRDRDAGVPLLLLELQP